MRTTTEDAPLLLLDTVASSSSSSLVSMMRIRNHKIGKFSSGAAVVVFSLLLFSVLAMTRTEDHQMSGKGRRGLVLLGGGHHTHHNHEGSSSLTSSVSSEKKQTRKGTKTLHKQEKPSSTLRLGKKKHKQTHKHEENPTCPQTYIRITNTNVKDNGEFEDGSELAYKLEYEESSRECEEKCNAEAACVGFMDYEDTYPKYCEFKTAVDGDDMEDYIGRDSYKKLEVTSYYVPHFNKWVPAHESDDEAAGYEKFVYEESAEECEEICTESETCEAYVDYKESKTPYCTFKTKDYVQSVLDTPAKDLYSKKICVPGQPVGKEVLEEFEEKPEEEEEEEEEEEDSSDSEEEEEEDDDDEDEDAQLAAMKKEAIEKFLKHKKETNAIKEAIAAAKAKNAGKTASSSSSTNGGHSKKPTWVKVVDDDEEEDANGEKEPKIKAVLSGKKKNKNEQEEHIEDLSSSSKSTKKSARLAQSKLTNFGEIAKEKAKKEEALAYAKKLFEHEKKVKAELAEKEAREAAEAKAEAELDAKKAAIKAKKEAKAKAKKEAEEKAAAEEKARLEEEEKKRLEEEEYKKNWASRWMANIEARTEKLAAKKEEKKLKETSALGGGFRNFVSKVLPLRTWEKSTPTASTTTNNNVVESAASQPQQFQQQQKQAFSAVAEVPDGRPTRDLSDDVAMRMSNP
ncbi:unnamed protein product [Bathycoccus prasinos]